MSDETNTPTTQEGGAPEWAKKMQETLEQLPDSLKKALTPDPPPPQPQEPQQDPPPVTEPVEIPVPDPLEPETEAGQEPEPPKKKGFWDWLL